MIGRLDRDEPLELADGRDQIRKSGTSYRYGPSYELLLISSVSRFTSQEPRKSDAPQLRDEYRSYKILSGCRTSLPSRNHFPVSSFVLNLPDTFFSARFVAGIPQVYYFGQEGLHNILVIDLLGPSMEDLFDMCGRKFSVKTCAMVAKQMVSRTCISTISKHPGLTRSLTRLADHPGRDHSRKELDLP